MSDPFVGEMRMFAGNFPPRGWADCSGQLLAISQNSALFSLFGTIYGGDGRTTFGLPDMRGRVPVHMGSGPGLTPRSIGQKGGTETVTLNQLQIPSHNHGGRLRAVEQPATSSDPVGNQFAISVGEGVYHAGTGRGSNPVQMNANALESIGGGQPHSNLAATQVVRFIVSLFGIYPSRN